MIVMKKSLNRVRWSSFAWVLCLLINDLSNSIQAKSFHSSVFIQIGLRPHISFKRPIAEFPPNPTAAPISWLSIFQYHRFGHCPSMSLASRDNPRERICPRPSWCQVCLCAFWELLPHFLARIELSVGGRTADEMKVLREGHQDRYR